MSEPAPRPSWLSMVNLGAGIQVLVLCTAVLFWVVTKADKADSTASAITGVNARLDNIAIQISTLPVMAEQINELREQLAGAKGDYASLDVRLRMIEQNNAANHADVSKALGRKP